MDSVKPLIRCLTPDPEGAAEFLIRDNLLLEKTGFFWNGEPLSPERQEETYRICLPEGERGELKVLAEDAAGNQTVFVKALEDKDPSPGKGGPAGCRRDGGVPAVSADKKKNQEKAPYIEP